MSQSVVILRKRLLSYSETFIAAQATRLPNYTPIFAGIGREASGETLLTGQIVCLQNAYARFPRLARGLLSVFGKPDKRWIAALKEYSPSLIHAHFGPTGVYGLALGKALEVPVVVTFHGYDITQNSVDHRYQRQRTRVFEQADKILAVSDFICDRLIASGCPASKVERHYIGIDNSVGSDPAIERAKSPRLVFVGRLVKQKGCDQTIEAMKTVRQRYPDAELIVIGTGPEKNELRTQAESVGGVSFKGKLTPAEIYNELQQAWILCNPSVIDASGATEGLGMVFLEAQAMGTPAVSYSTGGVIEAVVNGETGFTVETGNVSMLAKSVCRLIDDAELRRTMGRAARQHVEENFNLNRQCRKLEKIYSQVINSA